ncbi:polysaccharide biosynthesis/export family protein [Verrucomicrobiota bacterium sgz303538]
MPLLAQDRLLDKPLLDRPTTTAPTTSAVAPSNTVALTNSMEVLDDSRALGVGDRVSLRIVEERKPPVELIVTDSGEMEVPLIGRVSAKGKTCKALAHEVKRLLEKDYFYKCTVIIGLDAASQRSRGKIYMMGQIRGQGAMELPPDETLTVSRAILRAGGFADFANKRKVKVVRKKAGGQQETFIIDVLQILDKGNATKDLALQPDDLVIVPERLINF